MGTNYYYTPIPCPTCHHGDTVHIGKSSAGWTFSFHGTDQIRQFADWVDLFDEGGVITDEYDNVVPVADFLLLAASKSDAPHNHAKEHPEGSWLDDAGNSFSGGEFS